MKSQVQTVVLTMLCCLPIIRFAGVAFADEEVVTATTLEPPVSQQHAQYLSMLTKMAIARVATAQSDIEKKDYLSAQLYLRKANYILYVVNAEMPAEMIKASIENARGTVLTDKTEVVEKNLLPVYAALTEIQALMPEQVAQTKSFLDKAKEFLHIGKKVEAKEQMRLATVALHYGEVDVRLKKLTNAVEDAQQLLAQKNPQAAAKVLANPDIYKAFDVMIFLKSMSTPPKTGK